MTRRERLLEHSRRIQWVPQEQEDGTYKSADQREQEWMAMVERLYPVEDPDGRLFYAQVVGSKNL